MYLCADSNRSEPGLQSVSVQRHVEPRDGIELDGDTQSRI